MKRMPTIGAPGLVSRWAFTLIEISIVLVIIALIAGAIMLGQSMIRQTQVMKISVQEQQLEKAARSFRDKFNALPGDMTNATSYWGQMNGSGGAGGGQCGPSWAYSAVPQVATCNGDGNGIINGTGTGEGAVNFWEMFTAWQQMANAGFIQGAYSGTAGSASSWAGQVPGLNVPASNVPNAGFEWFAFTTSGRYGCPSGWFPSPTGGAPYPTVCNQQYLLFGGGYNNGDNYDLLSPVLTATEAQSIDSKIDDGSPFTGAIVGGGQGSAPWCWYAPVINGMSPIGYAQSGTGPACLLLFTVKW